MQIGKYFSQKTLPQLRLLQKQNPSKIKVLQMLVLTKEQGEASKYTLASQLGSSHSSVGKWRTQYQGDDIEGLLNKNSK